MRKRLESPLGIALAYFAVGVLWIVVTDYLVLGFATDSQTRAQIQTAKGWLFVGGSTALIYGLVWSAHRKHGRATDRLEYALQQTSILHRLLRHNLRNNCNIIQGNVELLEDDDTVPASAGPQLEEIRRQTDELVELGSKTKSLRDAVVEGDEQIRRLDLLAMIDAVVARTRNRYPDAAVETDLPERCRVRTTPRLEQALVELVDNAVEHHDRPDPTVRIELRETTDGVEITVADDGPGIPNIERAVLEEGIESPMIHSQGLGLWIARTIVLQAGGSVRLLEDEPRGTVVVLSLPN